MVTDDDTSAGPSAAARTLLPDGLAPGKIIAVHLNYPSRAAQRGRTPSQPSYFLKPVSSLAPSDATIERPAGTELLAFEGEVAVVIGTPARWVDPADGWSHVAAVTAANDFGLYDLRSADKGSNLRSKGGEGFTPLGPRWIPADDVDPAGLRVRTWVDGELVQEDSTATLLFDVGRLVADLSQHFTLEPGDVVLTGTPAGSSVVVPGQTVEVEVDAPDSPGAPTSGRLVTRVTAGTTPFGDFGSQPAVDATQRAEAWGTEPPATAAPAPAPVLTDDQRARFATVAVATLSAALRRRGHTDVFLEGVHGLHPDDRFVGPARTLRLVPFRPDLFAAHGGGYNAQKRAFDTVGPGEVLVVEARGERGTGTVGDVLALRAKVRGAAAVVTDGGVRDAEAVAEIGLPVFSAGPHPSVLGRRHVPWETDVTVACGGAAVQPGDVVVGDRDGALVIPAALVEEVLAEAEEAEAADAFVARQVAEGAPVDGLFPMDAHWRARYEAEREGDR